MLGSLGSLTKPKPPEKPAQKPAPVPAPVSAAPTVSIETVKEEYRSALNNPELLQALMQLNPANSRPSVAAAKTTTRFPSRAILKSR
jgi:hypothetical protein